MSSKPTFNILLERISTLDEMAQSFKQLQKGAATGDGGLNLMLKAYRNERTGKPVGAVSRVKNLIVLRALYDKDYINDEQFQSLAKKATSSNYISNTLKEVNPEAHDKLFGTAQESDDIIKHIKLNAKDMLNFGLTNLQGKNYVEVQEDEPEDPDAKELEDDVTSEVISLAKGLTSDDVEGTILDFDDVDVTLDGLENKEAITRKLVSILNGAGYTAEASGAGFNVEAPIGSFESEEKVQDLMAGLILKHFPGVDESLIDVKLNTTIEDAENFNEKPDLPGEVKPELDPRTAGEELNRDRQERELADMFNDRLHTPASDEEKEKAYKYTVIENDREASIQSMEYRQPEGDLIKTVKNGDLIKKCYQHPEGREWTVESDRPIDFNQEGSWTWDEDASDEEEEGAYKYTVIENDEDASIQPMEYRQPEGDLIKTVKSDGIVKKCYQHPEGREWVVESDRPIDFNQEGSWTWDEDASDEVEDAEGSIKQEVLNACKEHAGEFAHKAAGMAKACGEMYDKYGVDGDQEKAEIALSLHNYYKTQSKHFESEEANSIEDYETVTESFENQRHLNIATNSTSMYLTEQTKKDNRNNKQITNNVSFKERYKPKTSHQLAELRRYGL